MDPAGMRPPAAGSELESLLALDGEAMLELFRSLDAPPIAETAGFHAGHLPRLTEDAWRRFVADTGIGHWLGKMFLAEEGEAHPRRGHNCYRRAGEVANRLRFDVSAGASRYDGRPSILLHYGPYPNWAGQNDLIDELRSVAPGVMLGLYHTRAPVPGFTPRRDGDRSAAEFFVLTRSGDEASVTTINQPDG